MRGTKTNNKSFSDNGITHKCIHYPPMEYYPNFALAAPLPSLDRIGYDSPFIFSSRFIDAGYERFSQNFCHLKALYHISDYLAHRIQTPKSESTNQN